MDIAQKWPVMTSYDTLSTYAIVKGGRLPTEAELRLFLDMFDSGYEGGSNVGFRNWHPVPFVFLDFFFCSIAHANRQGHHWWQTIWRKRYERRRMGVDFYYI